MTRYIIANASTAPKSKKGKKARKQKATMMLAPSGSGLSFSRTPVRSHEVIAPRYRTNLMFEFAGNNNDNIGTTPVEFEISGNSVYFPGDLSPFTSFEATGGGTNAGGTTLGLGLAHTNASGFANMFKLYNAYRVYGSRITLCVRPSDGGEVPAQSARLIVVPFVADSASVFRASPEQALVQPFGKDIQISAVNTNRYNTITHTMATHTIYGTSLQAVRDEDSFAALANVYPANAWGWSVWYEPIDGLQSTIVVTVKVFYDVEFFNKNVVTEANS